MCLCLNFTISAFKVCVAYAVTKIKLYKYCILVTYSTNELIINCLFTIHKHFVHLV